jgi:hypothetical protein
MGPHPFLVFPQGQLSNKTHTYLDENFFSPINLSFLNADSH